ncbi:hypothetical protein G7054_g15136 [Neopestalotiopsis clavispora]|nr:hypothetical protein G7054_g15136 [Neopestalotiopsis clavispora]
MELRQSTSDQHDQHNPWFGSSPKKTCQTNRWRDLASQGLVRSSKWFEPKSSSTTNAVPCSKVKLVELYKANGDLTAELGGISATTFSRGSSQTPNHEEVCDSFSRAEYTPTKVAGVNELGIALCTASRALYVWDTLPIEISPKGAKKRPAKPEQQPQPESTVCFGTLLPPTSIMTPLAGAGEDEVSFPSADLDPRYHDTSDEDADDVYADFGVLFGSRADSLNGAEEDEHYYEEYPGEVKNIIYSS